MPNMNAMGTALAHRIERRHQTLDVPAYIYICAQCTGGAVTPCSSFTTKLTTLLVSFPACAEVGVLCS